MAGQSSDPMCCGPSGNSPRNRRAQKEPEFGPSSHQVTLPKDTKGSFSVSPAFKVEGESIAGAEFKGCPFCPHRPHREAGVEARPHRLPQGGRRRAPPEAHARRFPLPPLHFRTPAGLCPRPTGHRCGVHLDVLWRRAQRAARGGVPRSLLHLKRERPANRARAQTAGAVSSAQALLRNASVLGLP